MSRILSRQSVCDARLDINDLMSNNIGRMLDIFEYKDICSARAQIRLDKKTWCLRSFTSNCSRKVTQDWYWLSSWSQGICTRSMKEIWPFRGGTLMTCSAWTKSLNLQSLCLYNMKCISTLQGTRDFRARNKERHPSAATRKIAYKREESIIPRLNVPSRFMRP